MNHLSSRVQISSLRHHDAGRPAGEFGGLVKIRRRDRERAQVGDEPLLETQGIAAVLVVAAMTSELRSRMAGNPLLIRPFGAFEPVRGLSRPTERTAARAPTGSEEASRNILPEDLIPGTKTVVIGACAPIHPRVGPAVRPDVSIRGGPLFLLLDFGIFSHRHTSGPTR